MNDSEGHLKSELVEHLSGFIANLGSSHEVVARRLGIARADVTAIHNGDASRFSFERLRRMLRRVGRDVNIDIVDAADGGRVDASVSLEILGLSHLSDIPATTKPGLVLIAGEADSGQRALLRALIAEHVGQGANAVTYASRKSSAVLMSANAERIIGFETDVDLEQRERFGFDVIGVDAVGPVGADPWTVLHFAKDTRTYAVIESPAGAKEGQNAFDQMASLLGQLQAAKPYRKPLLDVLSEIIVIHAKLPEDVTRPTYSVSRHRPDLTDGIVAPADDAATQETLADFAARPSRPDSAGPMVSQGDANNFLRDVRELLGSKYSVSSPGTDTQREIEMFVRHRKCDASVTVAASWNPSAKRYGIVLCTDEPEILAESDHTPETRLSAAPNDASYVAGVIERFLHRFDTRA